MKKRITVFLVFLVFVFIGYQGICIFGISNINELFLHEIALEQMYYLVQIVASIAVVLGAVIGIWQYVLTARCERAKIKNDRIEKAIKLAEYYKDNILTNFTALKYVFKETGICNILENIKSSDMINFDSDELEERLSKADLKKISEIICSKKMAECILDADQIYGLYLEVESYISINDEEDTRIIEIQVKKIYRRFMSQVINGVLNDLEYFSMNFTHEVADDSVVYQSLHQTYLKAVQLLYYDISKNNKPDGSQFYTNVIELYRKWYKETQKRRENIISEGRNIKKGTSAENID